VRSEVQILPGPPGVRRQKSAVRRRIFFLTSVF
jgi:hypothetical protein